MIANTERTDALLPDEPHIERISQALWAREPVGSAALLVGAGFSRNATPVRKSVGSMPGWNDIYLTMVDQLYPAPPIGRDEAASPGSGHAPHRDWLLKQVGATSAYLRVAEEFEAQFGRDALDKLILRHVPDRQFVPGKLHQMLVQLPWADIMTTNWDTLLERAADRAEERVYDVLRTVEEIPEARAPRIIKLHGSFPAHRPFVFTEEDFRTYPIRSGAFVNLAQQLAMENTLVLLGFSGDDPNFLFWSGWVRDRLGPKAPLIYLVGVLGLSAPKRKMLESRRIQPIDLAQLPPFESWPASRRMEHAHQWFLERMREAEPYPAQRWPRPPAGFVPPLAFVTPRLDPRAPLPDPETTGHGPAVETLRRLVPQWRQNRSVFPGWIVPPLDTSELLWGRIDRSIYDIIRGLRAVEEDERLEALFELNWQLETALAPLILTVDDIIVELLDAMVGRYDDLDAGQAAHFRALVAAIIRHAREENDAVLFTRWADWLDTKIDDQDGVTFDRLTYERILWHRAELDVDKLDELVTAWEIRGDSFSLLRKAGLLADLGRDSAAADLSAQALNLIRAQTLRGSQDIAAWSRESFALLFRSSVLFGELGRWAETKAVRDRFDLRQDQLQSRGCPGKRDFFRLIDRLAQAIPPVREPIERTQKFDPGTFNVTHHLSGVDPRIQRLIAYQALRFQEETGLPVRIGNTGVTSQILSEAARWLMDVAPTRAIDAFLRAASSLSSKPFDKILTRSAVARMNAAEADRLIDRLIRLIDAARARIAARAPEAGFWRDRLKSTVEIASRVILRAPARAPQLLKICLSLYADTRFTRKMALGNELRHLARRSIEAASASDRDAMVLALFQSAIPPNVGDYASDAADVVAGLSRDYATMATNSEWREVVTQTVGSLTDPSTRSAASSRINWLLDANLLDEDDRRLLGDALWAPAHMDGRLPGDTVFYPSSFLLLPRPAHVDVGAAVSAALLTRAPLTDNVVAEGALAYAYGQKEFQLDEDGLLGEIARLHAFVADHAPPPEHPDILGDDRTDIVVHSSEMAASLAQRAEHRPSAIEPIRKLFALDRHPLRIEPALSILVRMGMLEKAEAAQRLRELLADRSTIGSELLGGFIGNVVDGQGCEPTFEAAMWSEIAQAITVRRPAPLARLLRFTAHVMREDAGRIPARLDEMLSVGLALILDETKTESPARHLEYDPSLVRYFGAVLVTAMAQRHRGDPNVQSAWSDAIDTDSLPDTRRARDKALEGVLGITAPGEGAGE
ncbi:SIR2 family NAD-dependent protein deacylase [Sphingomonas sp. 8AM]|uniref:SIR2 family NAD-dependent protein deacylase n=1 Tax=Sphingomonas sp. 8AM TaxID=2653170 RepID=UPI0012F0379D|nr:SIR2 family protein [Sphingomonas sp. 8AM]VXC80641.1 SIR2 family protein [Sphingomonas sp. 8AM]